MIDPAEIHDDPPGERRIPVRDRGLRRTRKDHPRIRRCGLRAFGGLQADQHPRTFQLIAGGQGFHS